MLVLKNPGAVLVLQDLRLLAYLNGTMASRRAAGTRPNVTGLRGCNWLQEVIFVGCSRRRRNQKGQSDAESNNSGGASHGATAQPSIHFLSIQHPGKDFKVCVLIRSQTIEINSETAKLIHNGFCCYLQINSLPMDCTLL